MAVANTKYYQAGGSLPANFPTYVPRKADEELFTYLQQGEFCYILTDRQMGKSSLKVRTLNRLTEMGWQCADIDITRFGSKGSSTEQWYYSLMYEIADLLDFEDEFDEWWEDKNKLTPVARMSLFWEEVLLEHTEGEIALFIDEIDSMLSLDKDTFSTDDFFAAIRATYNERSNVKDLQRLHFCILGVATPIDLMEDASRTPFNVGKPVKLENLDLKNSQPLLPGLKQTGYPRQVLKEIIYWTNGQPYLTQRLCLSLSQKVINQESDISPVVRKQLDKLFFQPDHSNQDPKISDIQKRILENDDWNARMLNCYSQILQKGFIPLNNNKQEQLYLKLTGLVREERGNLVVNNRIYEHIFDVNWTQGALAHIDRPYIQDVKRWLESGKSEDTLLKGTLLKEALEWKSGRDDLSLEEQAFIEASQINEARAQERNRQIVRLRMALTGVIILLVVSVIATIIAVNRTQEAKQSALVAKQNENLANTRLFTIEDQQKELQERLINLLQEQKKNYQLEKDKLERELERNIGAELPDQVLKTERNINLISNKIDSIQREMDSLNAQLPE